MASKRLTFSSNHFFDFFTTKQQEVRFFQDFFDRTLLRIHTMDSKAFKKCELIKTFEEPNISTFLYNSSRNVYPSLVKMLYSNIYLTDGIFQYGVKRHMISQLVVKFREILNPIIKISSSSLETKDATSISSLLHPL